MVAGAPFFLANGEGDGVTLGVSSAPGVAVGLEEGAEDSVGVGDGDGLRFFFFFFGEGLGEESGVGVAEGIFLFFGEGETVGSGVFSGTGLPEAFFFFEGEGDGDFSGVGDGFGAGDFSAFSFFFNAVELLRCFRGGGVGVGAKIFLILLPNDSSDRARSTPAERMAIKERAPTILLTRRMERESSTGAGDE